MRHSSITLGLAAFILILLTACSGEDDDVANGNASAPSNQNPSASHQSSAPGDTAAEISADVLARGAAAWKKGNCTMCHGADGRGNSFGPDLTDGQWNHSDGSVAEIRAILIAGIPKEEFVNSSYSLAMPSVTPLVSDEQDIDALAAYVKNLSSNSSPDE